MKKTYIIEVDCANCANKMEIAAGKIPGVESVSVNYFAQKMTVEFMEGAEEKPVMEQIRKACRKIERDFQIEL